jgi:hypothetical protein
MFSGLLTCYCAPPVSAEVPFISPWRLNVQWPSSNRHVSWYTPFYDPAFVSCFTKVTFEMYSCNSSSAPAGGRRVETPGLLRALLLGCLLHPPASRHDDATQRTPMFSRCLLCAELLKIGAMGSLLRPVGAPCMPFLSIQGSGRSRGCLRLQILLIILGLHAQTDPRLLRPCHFCKPVRTSWESVMHANLGAAGLDSTQRSFLSWVLIENII